MVVVIVKAIRIQTKYNVSSEFEQLLRNIDPEMNWGDNRPIVRSMRTHLKACSLKNKTQLLEKLNTIDSFEYKKEHRDDDRKDFDECMELSKTFLAELKKQLKI